MMLCNVLYKFNNTRVTAFGAKLHFFQVAVKQIFNLSFDEEMLS